MKTVLGLDLGTNSIGWALIQHDFDSKKGEILGMGSRIIPMSQDILGEFGKGNSVSQTADRTKFRSARRLRERHLLRRERLHRVLNILGFLPRHYAADIDFEKRLGQFFEGKEPKLAYDNNQFIFTKSFGKMLADFRQHQPDFLKDEKSNDLLIPYDWSIYYLRKEALTKKIEKEELAWIILNFNQKRGYYQLRGEEEEENLNKLVEFHSLKIIDVVADEKLNNKGETWYSLLLENGWTYRRSSKVPLFDWKEKVRDFIVTTDINDDGSVKTDKEGNEKRSFRAPSDDDWTLLKKKTEQDIDKSRKPIGAYIYDAILKNPKQKINGKLVRTVERKFYKEELKLILQKQKEFHPELQSTDLYNECIRELYKNNDAHQLQLNKKDFVHLFLEDIIFYQRPLRSQKSSVGNCPLEFRKFKDSEGIEKVEYLKTIPKSNPYFQEFRIWQWMYNLSIYKKDDDENVTRDFLKTIEDWEDLFEFLNHRKDIEQETLLKFLLGKNGVKGKALKVEAGKFRWNYVSDKIYPCNETKALIISKLEKVKGVEEKFLTEEIEYKLWHLIYSVTDKVEYEKALKAFAGKQKLDLVSFVDSFKRFPPFKNEYGAYSEKAIKKILPLLRTGKSWNWMAIDSKVRDRINKIITGEFDEEIKNKVREKAEKHSLKKENDFQGLPLWLAQYVVYGRHSEASFSGKWNSVDDLKKYLEEFKQHSLRNPIVEQVLTETLRVVADIWQFYGKGEKDFFSEIHIELGREMKNTAEDRKEMSAIIQANETTNLRIKALLNELLQDKKVENVRPYSPSQQEILKIYEDGVLSSDIEIPDDIQKISKAAQPTKSELQRYKLWLEQKYRSPYTGAMIPLGKLFTSEYEIEHIIPQSLYFDDSFSNKVICESAVNKLKDSRLGMEFIKECHGMVVETGFGKSVTVFEEETYRDFVVQNYSKNHSKKSKLLLEEIPEKMIERQMNDTRYISKFISSVLSNIVREEVNDDGVNSKNIVPGNGKITTQLKQDWGLNDIWNELILPRFERLNVLTDSKHFTAWSENHQRLLPTVPIGLSKGFSKKRIDHRHHALDALVIACASRNHINFLNNAHAIDKKKNSEEKQKFRHDLKAILCDKKYSDKSEKNYRWIFKKPWDNFTIDSKNALDKIIVSFKQNLRIINKATNRYEKWVDRDGIKVKEWHKQEGINWATRKPLHKDTVSGKVDLKRVTVPEGKILTATRKSLDTSFDLKVIESITDTGIQKILKNYLTSKSNNPELAFSSEGVEDMNKNIRKYNDGKLHQPIYKVRIFELGSKFPLGQFGNKKFKYVETAKGTNLFFAVYEDENKNRNYETIPLNVVIERQKQGLSSVPIKSEKGHKLLFYLSPNDIVYVPGSNEEFSIDRLYRFTDSSDKTANFIPLSVSSLIFSSNKNEQKKIGISYPIQDEFGLGSPQSKNQKSIDGIMIKEKCVKVNIDRLGRVSF
ncbi:CRISPR-associated protein Csn1 [Sporocytophaga myxococcoides]|uniref:CRISPR-associated endonuclease Cas9 n=1 Tax=Sporocytophaga myxococcoides TaxID=153721 RepID=A0A098LI38_9BACT|nr:type II CRISPR RNA-guided endonuclease Cas9 [Sporocytophaga myxococcoides]GAL86630.1 CRISPR-associated protein Csn1 [Sporocytophaga myxococcoides]